MKTYSINSIGVKKETPESSSVNNNKSLISNTTFGSESVSNSQFRFSGMKSESKSGNDNKPRFSNTMSGSLNGTVTAKPPANSIVGPKIEFMDENEDTTEIVKCNTKPRKEETDTLRYKVQLQKYLAMSKNADLELKQATERIRELEKERKYLEIHKAIQDATEDYFKNDVVMKAFRNPVFTKGVDSFSSYETYIKALHFPLSFADGCSTNNFKSVYCTNTLAVIEYFYPYCTVKEEIRFSTSDEDKPVFSKLTLCNSCTNITQVFNDGYFASNNAGIGGPRAELQHTRKFNMFPFLYSFKIITSVTGDELREFINTINEYKNQFNEKITDPVRLKYFQHALDEIGYYYLEKGTIPCQPLTLDMLNHCLNPDKMLESNLLFYTKKDLEKDPSLSPNRIFHSSHFTAELTGLNTEVQKQDVTEGTAKEDENAVVPIPKDYVTTREVMRMVVLDQVKHGILPKPLPKEY